MHDTDDKPLSSSEALEYMKCELSFPRSANTLASWAWLGTGPVYQKIGRLRFYRKRDLAAYVESITGPRRRGWRESSLVGADQHEVTA